MLSLCRTILDLESDAPLVRSRRYGLIEAAGGELQAIHLRPWPKVVSLAEIMLWGRWRHERMTGDRCWVYYNQPLLHTNYLALTYTISTRDCSLATAFAAMKTLDEVARIKRSDAILCEAWNLRLSDRFLARYGWEQHKPSRWHRHFIKRFYGVYPHAGSLVREAAQEPTV